MMKTSTLICNIVKNEGSLEYSKLMNYIEELIRMDLLAYDKDSTSIVLTDKGRAYIENPK